MHEHAGRTGERRWARRAARAVGLAVLGAALLVVAPGTASAGRIGSQARREGTVAENRAHADEAADRAARRVAVGYLAANGVHTGDADGFVSSLTRAEALDVAFRADLAWTVQRIDESSIDAGDVLEALGYIGIGLLYVAIAGYYVLLIICAFKK